MHENTAGGIKYESTMADIQKVASQYQDAPGFDIDYDFNEYSSADSPDEYQI